LTNNDAHHRDVHRISNTTIEPVDNQPAGREKGRRSTLPLQRESRERVQEANGTQRDQNATGNAKERQRKEASSKLPTGDPPRDQACDAPGRDDKENHRTNHRQSLSSHVLIIIPYFPERRLWTRSSARLLFHFFCNSFEERQYLYLEDGASQRTPGWLRIRSAFGSTDMKIVLSGLLLATLLVQAASFEVASIKPAVPDAGGSSGEDGRDGVLRVYNVTLKRCIRYAYAIAEDQISGGPKWIDDLRFDIVGKADHRAGEPELLAMLQPLLADHFKLEFHHESRITPGYALSVAKGGIKGKVSDPNRHSGANGGRGFIDAVACPVSELTIRLSALLGRPVVDMTGDKRKFDFHLRWTPDETRAGADSAASDSPSLFTALQEQLGLKLDARKVPADLLVVDHAELPSDN
jgi:uncharacterized protein (TIGR03435 family)